MAEEEDVLVWRSVAGGGDWAELSSLSVRLGLLEVELEEEGRASKSEIMIGRPTKSFMKTCVVAIFSFRLGRVAVSAGGKC
jgi:hypothetical protein